MSPVIRPADASDIPAIIALVRAVVFETYADLVARNGAPPPGDPARWAKALLAEEDGAIIGAGLRQTAYISDLWVTTAARRRGVGAALLAALEANIFAEHETARLRVVEANARARHFYARHGWRAVRTYPHERDGHFMVDMEKQRGG